MSEITKRGARAIVKDWCEKQENIEREVSWSCGFLTGLYMAKTITKKEYEELIELLRHNKL